MGVPRTYTGGCRGGSGESVQCRLSIQRHAQFKISVEIECESRKKGPMVIAIWISYERNKGGLGDKGDFQVRKHMQAPHALLAVGWLIPPDRGD
jgi:hypothetical protein